MSSSDIGFISSSGGLTSVSKYSGSVSRYECKNNQVILTVQVIPEAVISQSQNLLLIDSYIIIAITVFHTDRLHLEIKWD